MTKLKKELQREITKNQETFKELTKDILKFETISDFLLNRHWESYSTVSEEIIKIPFRKLVIIDTLLIFGHEYLVEIDKTNNLISFRNDICTVKSVLRYDYLEESVITKLYDKLIENLKEFNMFLTDPFGEVGNEDYSWINLSVKFTDFNNENVEKAINVALEHNKKVRKLIG